MSLRWGKSLYLIARHLGGFRGQLFGGSDWAEGLPGWPLGPVTAVVWKGEAEAERGHQNLHDVWSHLHVVTMAQQW